MLFCNKYGRKVLDGSLKNEGWAIVRGMIGFFCLGIVYIVLCVKAVGKC